MTEEIIDLDKNNPSPNPPVPQPKPGTLSEPWNYETTVVDSSQMTDK
jgi:hypothetical protein